jgi:hypothetical protein
MMIPVETYCQFINKSYQMGYFDSGAIYHMTSNKEVFSERRSLRLPQVVTTANGVKLSATGIGRVLTNKELLTLIAVL